MQGFGAGARQCHVGRKADCNATLAAPYSRLCEKDSRAGRRDAQTQPGKLAVEHDAVAAVTGLRIDESLS
jgi:hypothetical protein